ncbi:MAG: phosphoheptose isomerase [Saprospiraceae bacterium]|nr:phosphoheptose isomerase [Saprospiraceae bacterium]
MNDNKTNYLKLNKIKSQILRKGLHISSYDFDRPWGGFFVIDEVDTLLFIKSFYAEFEDELMPSSLAISPKILCVAPGQRLSWQYHHRRAELWKLIEGKAAYKKSDSDEEDEIQMMEMNKTLTLHTGERHRLIGLNEWGIIAEIWRHTDPEHPSDENDIVRLQDDYGR